MSILLKTLTAISIAAAVTACGGGGDEAPQEKNLFSLWTEKTTKAPLNLLNSNFGVKTAFTTEETGVSCTCTMVVTGTQQSGNASVSSCVKTGTDWALSLCTQLTGVYVYSKSIDTLTVITPSGRVGSYE